MQCNTYDERTTTLIVPSVCPLINCVIKANEGRMGGKGERFERRQSLDRPVEPSGQAVADDGESTREREYRVSDGGRDHDRCTGVMVLSQ